MRRESSNNSSVSSSQRSSSRRPRGQYFLVPGAVLLTVILVILVRLAWHMPFNAVIRWRDRRFGFHPPRPMLRPTIGSGLIISWSGMRGLVRQEFSAHLAHADDARNDQQCAHSALHRNALNAARQAVLDMRDSQEIGDDAFHQIEEDLDWLGMADRRTDR